MYFYLLLFHQIVSQIISFHICNTIHIIVQLKVYNYSYYAFAMKNINMNIIGQNTDKRQILYVREVFTRFI